MDEHARYIALIRDLQNQDDIGVDYQVEIVDEEPYKSVITFSIQNKGEKRSDGITPNKQRSGAGMIRFDLEVRHVWYYRRERPEAVIITLVDIVKQTVYWHPIQLDNDVEKAIRLKPDQESVTIYFDPKKTLSLANLDAFIEDVRLSNAAQSFRFNTNPPNGLVAVSPPPTGRLLDDIYNVFTELYGLLNFVPQTLLNQSYPFKVGDKQVPSIGPFKMLTDNKPFFDLFKAVERVNDFHIQIKDHQAFEGVDRPLEKMEQVMRWMGQNQIYYLFHGHRDSVAIYLFQSVENTFNPLLLLRRLQYSTLLEGILNNDMENLPLLSQAYIHHQLGNYITAQKILKRLAEEAKTGTLPQFIVYFNRYECYNPIRVDYETNNSITEILQEIKEIPLEITFLQCHNPRQKAIIEWIHRDKFLHSHEGSIASTVSKIKDVYHSQLMGGKSENDFVTKLQGEYGAYEGFIRENLLFFDRFQRFQEITILFAEGLFASYAITSGRASRLEAFDDWILEKLSVGANPDKLISLIKKYKLKKIKYRKNAFDNDSFTDIAKNVLTDGDKLQSLIADYRDGKYTHFETKYNDQVSNIIILSGILELEKDVIEMLFEKLIPLIEQEGITHGRFSRYFIFFLFYQGSFLTSEIFKKIFLACIQNDKWHINSVFYDLTSVTDCSNLKISFTDMQFQKMKDFYFTEETSGLSKDDKIKSASYLLPNLLNSIQSQEWLDSIQNSIEITFNTDAYAFLCATNTISYDERQFNLYKSKIISDVRKEADIQKRLQGQEEFIWRKIHLHWLNDLIELSQKFKVNFSVEEHAIISELHPYYAWLLNMEDFDYIQFNPIWLRWDRTGHFKEQFRNSKKIRKAMETHLSTSQDILSLKTYFNLYNQLDLESDGAY